MKNLFQGATISVCLTLILTGAHIAYANGVPLSTGEVLAGTGNSLIKHFDSLGNLLDTLDTTSGSSEETGMCFEANGNLITTNFEAGTASKFDSLGNLLLASWAGPFSIHPESCVRDSAGHIYTGEVDGANDIRMWDTSGNLLAAYAPLAESRGTDWIDLSADQCTMLYTSEGSGIHSFNVCSNTQNPDFATGLSAPCYALRIRSNGEVMVACLTQAYRLDSNGNTLQTYPIANENLFAMNLDPSGSSFWTGGYYSGNIYKVDIASGTGTSAPLFNVGTFSSLAGLAIVGEPTAATSVCSGTGACFTGGGGVRGGATMGLELHCNTTALPNNLQVNWGKGNHFHLGSLTTVACTNNPAISPNPPAAGFNTITGTGTGRLNGVPGATISFALTDAGEPGRNDSAAITITPASGPSVTFSGTLVKGNLQAHK